MEIIEFKVREIVNSKLTIQLNFDAAALVVKAENGKAYFNEHMLSVIINKENDRIRNFKTNVSFMSFDEEEEFNTKLDDLVYNSDFMELCYAYINNISEVTDHELETLLKEIEDFSKESLIDYALRTGNKKLFMELTNQLKTTV